MRTKVQAIFPMTWAKLSLATLPLLMAGLTGCGMGNFGQVPAPPVAPPAPPPYTGPTFTVKVLAGGIPLVGSSLRFYAAGTTGNGSTGTALFDAVKTDATGTAAIPANYQCPAATSLTYLVATGGTVAASTTTNANTVLLAAVGPCGSLTASSSLIVNEVTSVAALYALEAFYQNGQIGATASNLAGLTNAFQTVTTLVNATTGSSAGTALPANGSSPAMRINSIANAVNACIVKTANCAALYAQSPNGTPANTLEALSALARSAGRDSKGIAAIFAESQQSGAYAPALTVSPSDWSLFVTYKGGGLNYPAGIGVDSTGNVWVANYYFAASKFSTIGAPVFANGITGSGLNNSFGLAIDTHDNVWIPNEQPYSGPGTIGSVTVLDATGAALSGPRGYTAGGLDYPLSVAIDPNGTTWVVDYGNSHLTLLNASGAPLSGPTGYTTPLFAFPVTVAVDGNHFGWVGNQADSTVTRVAPDGSDFRNYNCCHGASGIAIDAGNNVWIANFFGDSVSMIASSGAIVSNGAYTAAGTIDHPQGIAIDGAGNVFVANYRAGYLNELAGAAASSPGAPLSPTGGLGGDANLLEAFALAIDASGNVWVSNQGSDTITKFIGVATPVKTPLSGLPKIP